MGGLLTVFLLWCVFAVPVGWVLATMESKVNHAPPRMKNAILLSVLLGPIGWIFVAARSNLKFASGMRGDTLAQGDVARRQLARDAAAETGPAVVRPQASGGDPATSPPVPAGWYPDWSGSGQRYWDGGAWTEHTHS
jgi:Protein of unknown function (DUF2510)